MKFQLNRLAASLALAAAGAAALPGAAAVSRNRAGWLERIFMVETSLA